MQATQYPTKQGRGESSFQMSSPPQCCRHVCDHCADVPTTPGNQTYESLQVHLKTCIIRREICFLLLWQDNSVIWNIPKHSSMLSVWLTDSFRRYRINTPVTMFVVNLRPTCQRKRKLTGSYKKLQKQNCKHSWGKKLWKKRSR
jgi:hypothetical protein